MNLDLFYIQHTIISIPKTLTELLDCTETLSGFFKSESDSSISINLVEGLKRLKGLHQDIIISTGQQSNTTDVDLELEPLVLNLKREMFSICNDTDFFSQTRSSPEPGNPEEDVDFNISPQGVKMLATLINHIENCCDYFKVFPSCCPSSIRPNVNLTLQNFLERGQLSTPNGYINETPFTFDDTWLNLGFLAATLEQNAEEDGIQLEESHPESHPSGANDDVEDPLKKALVIINRLPSDKGILTLKQGVGKLCQLSYLLYLYEMYGEAVSASTWAVNLLSHKLCPEAGPLYEPYLVMALQNHMIYLRQAGEVELAWQTIVDPCLAINKKYQSKSALNEYAHQLGRTTLNCGLVAQEVQTYDKALRHALDSVRILESLLDEGSHIANPFYPPSPTRNFPSNWNPNLLNPKPTPNPQHLYDFTLALYQLAYCRKLFERFDYFVTVQKKALLYMDKLMELFPTQCPNLQAKVFSQFAHSAFESALPRNLYLGYLEKALTYTRILVKSSKRHIFDLAAVLACYASNLEKDRMEDALQVWRELLDVDRDFFDPQYIAEGHNQMARVLSICLRRHTESIPHWEAAIWYWRYHNRGFSVREANCLVDSATALNDSNRHQQSAAGIFLAIFEHQTLHDENTSNRSTSIAECYTGVADCLSSIGDYEGAIHYGSLSVEIFQAVSPGNNSMGRSYTISLEINISIAYQSNCELSLRHSTRCIGLFIKLNERFPATTGDELSASFVRHSSKLDEYGLTEDAVRFILDSLPWFERQTLGPEYFYITDHYIMILNSLSHKLDILGRSREALPYCLQALEIVNKHPLITRRYISSRPTLLIALGKYEEALDATTDEIKTIELGSLRTSDTAEIYISHSAALVANGKYEEAEAAAQKGALIAQTDPELDSGIYSQITVCRSQYALADALFDIGRNEEALVHAKRSATTMDRATKCQPRGHRHPYGDLGYLQSSVTLGALYLSVGQLGLALSILNDRVCSEVEKFKKAPGLYRIYALALRLSGWCLCALGQHEEGAECIAALEDILRTLDPELATVIKVRLDWELRRPSYTVLWEKLDLKCGHQTMREFMSSAKSPGLATVVE